MSAGRRSLRPRAYGVQVKVVGSFRVRLMLDPAAAFLPGSGSWTLTTHVDGIGVTPDGSEVTVPTPNPSASIAVVASACVLHR